MNPLIEVQEKLPLKGRYTFTLHDVVTAKTDVFHYENVITRKAWELIANHFADPTPTHSMLLNKAALGTGTNVPDVEDLGLQTEVYRNNLASKSDTGNIVSATAYFSTAETVGTYREAGMFSDGGTGANTGVLVSHVGINITKTNTQTLTIDFTLTVGN